MFHTLLKIQKFFESLYQSLVSFLRVLLRMRFNSGFKKVKTQSENIIILANGPSLKGDLEAYSDQIGSCSTMGVNLFAISEAFRTLKPKYYTILDINFFREDTILERVRESREKMIQSLKDNLNWEMVICLPAEGRNTSFHKRLSDLNLPLIFVFFNRTSIDGFRFLRHCMYSKGWGMPSPQNVLIGAIMATINIGFKKIYLLGADHSWHEEIHIVEDGTFKITDKHFYNLVGKDLPKHHGEDLRQFKINDFFSELAKTFKSHLMIQEFAKKKGISILNASSVSYIDAYEKINIGDIKWDQLLDK